MSALSNAVSVLRLFSTERPELSVTEVSRLLDMPKSSASRLLKSMLREGLLANVGATPRYRVGHVFFEISRLYGRNSTLMDLTDNALGEICRAVRHGGYISILDGADALVLRAYIGPETLRVVTPLGSRMAAFATSTGRTLLARLSNEAIKALHPQPLVPPSPNAPQNMGELMERIDQIRRCGWCEAIDEGVPGVGSVAVSIADRASAETLAFCVSFPAHPVSELERRRFAVTLTDAARRLATQVDDQFWTRVKAPKAVAA
ncbi:IclR family transcriptional regulator [Vineibacter terrae]|uniref:IclR family transcriptional regulator n=2 Tax=Vineibacter terrae TaxID=2586908 RepID=A0A5C8PRX7_9HYPH|nr:IclR family transcriptional regulator [Vineibacter terrae]